MARFAIRSLYRWASNWTADSTVGALPYLYEERIVLFEASSDEEALGAASIEAKTYAEANQAEFLGRLDSYEIDDGDPEVFSELRRSALDAEAFKSEFYRDSDNHSRMIDSD